MAWTLCSKADVMSIHPISASALNDFWSETVEALIRQHLGTPYLGLQQVITSEKHDGDSSYLVIVKNPPIISVTSFIANDYLYPASEYEVRGNAVELLYQALPEGHLNVIITYVSGTPQQEAIDPVVRMTAAAMVVAIANYNSRAGADGSIKWGSAEQKEAEPTPTFKIGLTSNLVTIMKRMLRREKVRTG